jgi:hypothetical protein
MDEVEITVYFVCKGDLDACQNQTPQFLHRKLYVSPKTVRVVDYFYCAYCRRHYVVPLETSIEDAANYIEGDDNAD